MLSQSVPRPALTWSLWLFAPALFADCEIKEQDVPDCVQLETVTIFGSAQSARDVAGGASVISPEDLEKFEVTNVVQALREVPGVAVQLEDGYGLRPNISIRGTASERSSRVTLLEDGVLIAPAPYSAPSAYYFPTFGRIHSVEILKGPAAITQGPYTVGGAINLISTPIPDENSGFLQAQYGSDSTWNLHGWYGGGNERVRALAETYQWQSDGYQEIDRSENRTGLQKHDYLGKLALYSSPEAEITQNLELKLQSSSEDSQQSYLGLTDADFERGAMRRYGLSADDEMHNKHSQAVVSWRLENATGSSLTTTAYVNHFRRAWYKTEAFDADGSAAPESFRGTGWSNIIDAVNLGDAAAGLDAAQLQAVLDGADTASGSIQLRNNSRKYYAKGVQLLAASTLQSGSAVHQLQAGLRFNKDQEDRLQRNDNYQQLAGQLVLNATGLEGNAGNQVQEASAWAAYLYDRIEFGSWTLTPGLRYENIGLSLTRYLTNSDDPASRDPDNFRDYRENDVSVWLPGMGAIYGLTESTRLVGGIHRGFATPGNEPGVDPEESTNYELGLRHEVDRWSIEAMFFFNDYQNLVGVCTNSSGSDCDPGAAFSGEGVHIPGLEVSTQAVFDLNEKWQLPVQLAYTWMNAKFQSSFDSEFFGEVNKGDPVPYIPSNQLWVSIGLTGGPWSFYLGSNYVDSVCTRASCGPYEKTGNSLLFDLAAHYQINPEWQIFAVIENLADKIYLVAREPYGARPNKPRSLMAGVTFAF